MKRIILIDGNNVMFRAYYGTASMGNLMQNSKGLYTNAIYGFAKMLNNIMAKEPYDAICVAFDKGKKTFRHQLMPETYKAGRATVPDEFKIQIPYIKKYLDLANVFQYENEELEADDIVSILAKKAVKEGYRVDIYSNDKDLLQLVDENITVYSSKPKGVTEVYDLNHFKEVYSITPTQFIDLKALMGDTSDNLPGIQGIGEKTGIKLLLQYGSIENLIANEENLKGALKTKVANGKEMGLLCKKMTTLISDYDLPFTLDDLAMKEPDGSGLRELYEELEFKSFM